MYIESLDRALVRKAGYEMTDVAMTELAKYEVDELDETTRAFISAVLSGILARPENDSVTSRFGVFDLERLSDIRTGFEVASAPQPISVTGRIELTENEVLNLQSELTGLQEQLGRLTQRIDSVISAIVRSGEAKLREIQKAQFRQLNCLGR